MKEKIPVSINIAAKDRHAELAILLSSLLNQTVMADELILVDGSETPIPSRQFLAQLINEFRIRGMRVIIAREETTGVCQARNQCVKLSRNEWLCRIDDDSWCEPDYLERLWNLVKDDKIEKIGGAGGVVPVFGAPRAERNTANVPKIFNLVEFDKEANMIKCSDDGGWSYYPNETFDSHHLRSSFLFRKSAWEKVNGFPIWCGKTGWREETIFCMGLVWNGYKLLTDTGAKAWHLQCQSGGLRFPDYGQELNRMEPIFLEWAKRNALEKGNPFCGEKEFGEVTQ